LKIAQKFLATFFHGMYVLILTKNGLGWFWGNFFKYSSCHPTGWRQFHETVLGRNFQITWANLIYVIVPLKLKIIVRNTQIWKFMSAALGWKFVQTLTMKICPKSFQLKINFF
jgi:hypothetical protein